MSREQDVKITFTCDRCGYTPPPINDNLPKGWLAMSVTDKPTLFGFIQGDGRRESWELCMNCVAMFDDWFKFNQELTIGLDD